MNITKRLIEALQAQGHKVRYTSRKYGRGTQYFITGIDRANYKNFEKSYAKALTLVSYKRSYTASDKTIEQRAKAREAKALIASLPPEAQELYRKATRLWKDPKYRANYKERYPKAKKLPSIKTYLKGNIESIIRDLKNKINTMKGKALDSEVQDLAEWIEIIARKFKMQGQNIDVYFLVAKLRSRDTTMLSSEYKKFSSILKDSNNPDYYLKQADPFAAFVQAVNELKALVM